jgi:hypothetical protein
MALKNENQKCFLLNSVLGMTIDRLTNLRVEERKIQTQKRRCKMKFTTEGTLNVITWIGKLHKTE